jgi:outer membrane protein TolC
MSGPATRLSNPLFQAQGPCFSKRKRWHRFALALTAAGCAPFGVLASPQNQVMPTVRPSTPAVLPPAKDHPAAAVAEHGGVVPPEPAPKPVPINLDTVLRLAESQNAQIAIARARLEEACADKSLADKGWLPTVYVGTAYYRHEGGIADEEGSLVHSSFGSIFAGVEITSRLDLKEFVFQKVNAERQVRQQRGEISRVTSETLLDASSTYVDILAARTGEAIARSMKKDLENLLERTQKLASTEPGARIEVNRVQAQLQATERIIVEMRQDSVRAAFKLAYVLGLDPSTTELIPVDDELIAFDLVDVSPPVSELVARALTSGPGVREMESLLALINETMQRSQGCGKYMPIFETRVDEGAFGTGPGDDMRWDNRLDLGLQVRWNLTNAFTAKEQRRILDAKSQQAHLAYQDLRGKLTAGVQESREAIIQGREQMKLGKEQIQSAREAHRLSDERLRNTLPGSSASEVLLSLQALSAAQGSYLNAIRGYDKAQLRLMVLVGAAMGPIPDCCKESRQFSLHHRK